MELSKVLNGITINVNINLSDEAVKMIAELLSNRQTSINNVVENIVKDADIESPVDEKKSAVRHSKRRNVGRKTRKNKTNAAERTQSVDIEAVCATIREYAELVKNGVDVREASDAMHDKVMEMTDKRVDVYMANFGRYHILTPNFRFTQKVAAMYKRHWPGWVSLNEMESVLRDAFSRANIEDDPSYVSTTPLGGERAKSQRPTGYTQGSYKRVKRGSMMMRMRCHRGSNELAPMVIDATLGEQLFSNGYTHVKIGAPAKNQEPIANPKSISLIFTKEDVRTRAETKSKTKSRLHPYGKSHTKGDRISTYAINGDAFQRSILKFFGDSCTGTSECFYRLVQAGKENEKGIAYRIEKA